MALVIADRVRETSTTTGTGTLTLDGAVTGFRTFSSAIGNTNTCYYTITMNGDWEVGVGTVGAGTLARTTILKSSNSNNAVNWGAGTKDVFATYPGEKAVTTDGTETLTNKTITNPTVNGSSTVGGQINFAEASNNGSNYIGLVAPASVSTNLVFTLPATDGTSGQVLQTNGSGTLSFATSSGISTGKAIAMAIVFGG